MRILVIPGTFGVLPSKMALEQLSARFAGCCMLPNLRRIHWFFNERAERHIALVLPLLVSPLLNGFKSHLHPAHAQVVVSALAPAYDSLQSICITQPGTEPAPELSALLFRCNSSLLRELDVGSPLSWKAFLYTSQLPNLEDFVIRPGMKAEPLGGAPLPATMFPSLRWLGIDVPDTDSIWLQSLARIHSKNLQLVLELKNPLAARIGLPATLEHFRSGGSSGTRLLINPNFLDFKIDGTTIEHLLSFTQVTALFISVSCSSDSCRYELSDEDLEKLVKGMPRLENLNLGFPCSQPANNSLKSLVAVARHCKYLDVLFIHINVEAVVAGSPDRDDYTGEDPILGELALTGCPLRRLGTFPYPALGEQKCAKKFALTLLQLFPNLVKVKYMRPMPGENFVAAAIHAMRRVSATVTPAQPCEFVSLCYT